MTNSETSSWWTSAELTEDALPVSLRYCCARHHEILGCWSSEIRFRSTTWMSTRGKTTAIPSNTFLAKISENFPTTSTRRPLSLGVSVKQTGNRTIHCSILSTQDSKCSITPITTVRTSTLVTNGKLATTFASVTRNWKHHWTTSSTHSSESLQHLETLYTKAYSKQKRSHERIWHTNYSTSPKQALFRFFAFFSFFHFLFLRFNT